jgi:hypothetical protein
MSMVLYETTTTTAAAAATATLLSIALVHHPLVHADSIPINQTKI